jgi:hypothetical protein
MAVPLTQQAWARTADSPGLDEAQRMFYHGRHRRGDGRPVRARRGRFRAVGLASAGRNIAEARATAATLAQDFPANPELRTFLEEPAQPTPL